MFGERTLLVGPEVEPLPTEVWGNITTEEQLAEALNIPVEKESTAEELAHTSFEPPLDTIVAQKCHVCNEVFDQKTSSRCSICNNHRHGKPPCSFSVSVDNDDGKYGDDDDNEKIEEIVCHWCHRETNIENQCNS